MKIVTLLNEKGGVGKTSLSRHLAAGLARVGANVMLLDADPQAHSTFQMRIKDWGGLYRLLVQDDEWRNVTRLPDPAAWKGDYQTDGKLYVLPGNVETRAIPGLIDDVRKLRERLEELEGFVDYVVIDTSPTPSLLQSMIYIATDALIYPTQAQSLSLDGLSKSVHRMTSMNKTRQEFQIDPVKLIGVVPTMVRPTSAHQHGLELIEKHFGTKGVLPSLSLSTVWQDAEYNKETLYTFAPDHAATAQMNDVLTAVQARIS